MASMFVRFLSDDLNQDGSVMESALIREVATIGRHPELQGVVGRLANILSIDLQRGETVKEMIISYTPLFSVRIVICYV